jgi:hypothetical protein
MILTASFIITLVGAFGTQMPRNKNTRIGDKVSEEKLNEINKDNSNGL